MNTIIKIIIILQDNVTCFMLIKDVPMFTQETLVIQVREFGMHYRKV